MDEDRSINKSTTILVINLILLGICSLGLIAILIVYSIYRKSILPAAQIPTASLRSSATSSHTPTITVSPTITLTPRPTSTSTITPSPSWSPTPSSTFTQTPFPSLTPALAAVYEGAYKLVEWNPEEANRMIQILQGYPAGIQSELDQPFSETYLQAYSYPIFALQEALLRFPDASQAESWRWKLAYDYVLNGDQQAGAVYARDYRRFPESQPGEHSRAGCLVFNSRTAAEPVHDLCPRAARLSQPLSD